MSQFYTTGLSIQVSEPLFWSTRSDLAIRLGPQISSYSHDIQAFGGYWSAQIGLTDNRQAAENWVETGLGKHVQVHNPALSIIWEGFVNQVTVAIGPLSLTIGPLLDVCNKVHGRYTDFTTNLAMVTSTAQDTTSQTKYSIRYRIVNIGQVSSTTADKIRDTFLAENKYPKVSQSVGQSTDISISLECLGYVHMLDYPYLDANSGTYTLREKLLDILADEPNSLLSARTDRIDANTLSVFKLETDGKKAIDAIRDLVNMGAASTNDRMLFGLYAERLPVYTQVPTAVEYVQRLAGGGPIKSSTEADLQPWDILPGKWLHFTDLLIGRKMDMDVLLNNPNLMFIESVKFSFPDSLGLTGGNAGKLSQQLSKLGLSGIS